MTKENSVSRRYLALVFPWLPIERLRATRRHLFATHDEIPTAIVEKTGNALRLAALDQAAALKGLVAGLTLADARAQCPDLAVFDHDPVADLAWLGRLADGCERYTPLVAIDPPDGLILDITGCLHLFGGEQALVGEIEARFAKAGVSMRSASGNTPDAAYAFVRFGKICAIDERAALACLPIAALNLDDDATVALGRAGLKTIGDVLARPLAGLAARFGADAATKLRRLTGDAKSPLTPRRKIASVWFERRFAEPVGSSDYVLTVLSELTKDAAGMLEQRHEGGRRFEARLFRSDGMVHRLNIETGQPMRDVKAVMRLFGERIGGLADPLDPGFGYDLIRLDIAVTERLDATQLKLEGGAPAGGEVAELIDRLSTRLGRDRVRHFVPQNSHIPEQTELMLPATMARPVRAWPKPAVDEPPYRPIFLFDPPQSIDLILFETPDGPPKRFRWRRHVHEIACAEGPERIAGEWWRHGVAVRARDYYRVEDRRGRRYWIFRHGIHAGKQPPRWYIHGLFA